MKRAPARDRVKLETHLLQRESVIQCHCDRWSDVVLCMASWMREASAEADRRLGELAIVARKRSPTDGT